jgi:hypothetical protein
MLLSDMKAEEVAPPAASSCSCCSPQASAKKRYVDNSFMDSDYGSDSGVWASGWDGGKQFILL